MWEIWRARVWFWVGRIAMMALVAEWGRFFWGWIGRIVWQHVPWKCVLEGDWKRRRVRLPRRLTMWYLQTLGKGVFSLQEDGAQGDFIAERDANLRVKVCLRQIRNSPLPVIVLRFTKMNVWIEVPCEPFFQGIFGCWVVKFVRMRLVGRGFSMGLEWG